MRISRVLSICVTLGLAACQSPGTRVTFPSPVVLPAGKLLGYYDPDRSLYDRSPPTPITIVLESASFRRPQKLRLVEGRPKLGLTLASVRHHSYTIPMKIDGGPPLPGEFSGGVGMVTHDVVIRVEGAPREYLILRDRGVFWSDVVPPPFSYGFSDKPGLKYEIFPGNHPSPKPTKIP